MGFDKENKHGKILNTASVILDILQYPSNSLFWIESKSRWFIVLDFSVMRRRNDR